MKKLFTILLALVCSVGMWATNLISFSRPSTTNVISTGFSYDGNLSGKTGYMQDNSSNATYWMSLSRTTALFSTAPTSLTLTANLGGGTKDKELDSPIYACLIDNEGNEINNTAVEVTSSIGAKEGTDYQVSLSTTAATSAYGIKIYHEKTASYNVRFYSVSLDYVSEGGTVDPVEATWSVSPSTVTIETDADATVEITTNYDGTLEVRSDATGVATAAIEGKIITVHGVSTGSANIIVTGAATSDYKAIDKQFSVSVVAGERPYTSTINLSDKFGYSYFGATPEGTNAYAQPDETNRVKTDDILTMTIARNGSSNTKPRYDASYLRFYKGNTLTIAVPSNFNITSVTFVEPSSGSEWSGSMSAPSGVYNNTTKKWTASSDLNTITFTGETGTNRIGGIIVRVNGPEYSLFSISEAGYATYFNADQAYVMPENLEGITVEGVTNNTLTLETRYAAGSVVPAGEALVLHGAEGNYILYAGTTSNNKIAANMLKGTSTAEEETTGGAPYYRLSQHDGQVGFYWGAAEGAAFQPGANKAYLALNGASAPARFIFGQQDVPTEVVNVNDNNQSTKVLRDGRLYILRDGNMFDLNGRLVK